MQALARNLPAAGDRLGEAIAVDGDLLVAGMPGRDDALLPGAGGAVVWRRDASLTWKLEQEILLLPAPGITELGEAVALSGDYMARAMKNSA